INNPLSIITGYGERAIQKLEHGETNGDIQPLALKSLRTMCEEAYRCKAITDKLLSLARPGDEPRAPISLASIAGDVVSLLEAHPASRDRSLTLRVDSDPTVLASTGELKQVLLNLTLNALAAVPPTTGQVTISIASDDHT